MLIVRFHMIIGKSFELLHDALDFLKRSGIFLQKQKIFKLIIGVQSILFCQKISLIMSHHRCEEAEIEIVDFHIFFNIAVSINAILNHGRILLLCILFRKFVPGGYNIIAQG